MMKPPQEKPLPTITERYRAGDERVFQTLFDSELGTYQARVRRWFDQAILRKVSIADILQEVRIVVFQRRLDFTGEDPASFRGPRSPRCTACRGDGDLRFSCGDRQIVDPYRLGHRGARPDIGCH